MAEVDIRKLESGKTQIVLSGRLDVDSTAEIWKKTIRAAARDSGKLEVEASGVDYCDGAGVGLLLEIKKKRVEAGGQAEIVGLKPQFEELISIFDPGRLAAPEPRKSLPVRYVEQIGKAATLLVKDIREVIDFTGEITWKLTASFLRPHTIRWRYTVLIGEKSGANAIGIAALLGFLIGLILAFQSAVSLRPYGAQVFIADLVAIALFRELGPFFTAIIFVSRSGSAFAAELGTMKVNEELDALTTMGLDPVKLLVIPRVIAAVVMMPLLTMFSNLLGLIGCGVVMMSLGFTPATYMQQVQSAVNLNDLFGGLFKTLIFGMAVAQIGCLRGLQTGTGASAVGDSATRAVVSGIVALVAIDGVFAVIYYYLGI